MRIAPSPVVHGALIAATKCGRLASLSILGLAQLLLGQEMSARSARVEYSWALTLQSRGDLEGAVGAYTEAIRMDPWLAEAYNDRGNALLTKGDIEKALADFDRAIQIRRRFAQAYNSRGMAHMLKGDLAGAMLDFSKAIESKSDFREAWANRGTTRLHSGDARGALHDLDKAIRLFEKPHADASRIALRDPGLAKAFINRGVARYILEDFDGAISDFDRALEIDPSSAEALRNRALAQERRGKTCGRDL